jgi:hypothetical protein
MKDLFNKGTDQPDESNFKEVTILVTKPADTKMRVRIRDEIVNTARKMGAKVLDCEPKIYCALISCDDDIKDKLKQRFPEATIGDNVGGNRPAGPAAPKP